MADIRIKSGDKYYLSPGKEITSVPVFGGTSASFNAGSPVMAATDAKTYTYISKIKKKVGNEYKDYYISNISAPLIKNLYSSKTIYINGSSTPILFRRYKKIYYGFVSGKGGNGGSSGKYVADERTGGGGGGAGSVLFIFSLASDNEPTFTLNTNSIKGYNYNLIISCDGCSITLGCDSGGDGGSGSSACNGGGGNGGSAGDCLMSRDDGNTYHSPNSAGSSNSYRFQYGPFYFIGILVNGTGGAGGDSRGNRKDADDTTVTFSSSVKESLGISQNVSWTRSDGQGGASGAPGVNENGGTSWYGSAGQQSGYRYWSVSYDLE